MEGYQALYDPPPTHEIAIVNYLLDCLQRLIEIIMPNSSASVSKSHQILLSKKKISDDDRVLLFSLIIRYLKKYLFSEYHLTNSIIPAFHKVIS